MRRIFFALLLLLLLIPAYANAQTAVDRPAPADNPRATKVIPINPAAQDIAKAQAEAERFVKSPEDQARAKQAGEWRQKRNT